MARLSKNTPAMWDTWSFDPQPRILERGKSTHSSILAQGIHGLYSQGSQEWDT